MRMRKKKNSQSRLEKCSDYLFEPTHADYGEEPVSPTLLLGCPNKSVMLEIGAGKGRFACEMARRNPDSMYFAMERSTDCVVLGAERAASGEFGLLDNLRFVIDTADNLLRIFPKESVSSILLNFSDPWPKKGYAKRRLTHKRYLAVYLNLLSDGGTLTFKTDNVSLFDFSIDEIRSLGLEPEVMTRDLHASEWNADNIMTEYEENFSSQGYSINMLRIRKPVGFKVEIPADFTAPPVRYSEAE